MARLMLWFVSQTIQALALLCAVAFAEDDSSGAGWWFVAAIVLGGIYGSAENLRGYYDGLHRARSILRRG